MAAALELGQVAAYHPRDAMHNDHDHEHEHEQALSPGRGLLASIAVSGLLMLLEVVGGLWSGSLALLADAGHMLTDTLALGVAYAALSFGSRPADARRTFGYRRLEILAALANGVALVVVSGSIAIEAYHRWSSPMPIDLRVMSVVAGLGLVGNLTSLVLLRGHGDNLNLRGAFLHVLGDTLSSVGVLVGAATIWATGWQRVDAVIALGIAFVIVFTSVRLLREVVDVLLESVPRGLDCERVRASIGAVAGVAEVHDLHIWSIASGVPALSAHVIVDDPGRDSHAVLEQIQARLRAEFTIRHSTLQVERRGFEDCGCC